MAFQTGSQINPNYGTTDYSPFLLGATKGAEMTARGGESIGRGVSLLSEGINRGLEKYKAEKDESDNLNQAAEVIGSNLLRYAQQFSRDPAKFGDNNPVDDKYLEMLTGIAGKSLPQKRAIVGSGAAAMASASNAEHVASLNEINRANAEMATANSQKAKSDREALSRFTDKFRNLSDRNNSTPQSIADLMYESGMSADQVALQVPNYFSDKAFQDSMDLREEAIKSSKLSNVDKKAASIRMREFYTKNPQGFGVDQTTGSYTTMNHLGDLQVHNGPVPKQVTEANLKRIYQFEALINAKKAQLEGRPDDIDAYFAQYQQNTPPRDQISSVTLRGTFDGALKSSLDVLQRQREGIYLGTGSSTSVGSTQAPVSASQSAAPAASPVAATTTAATTAATATAPATTTAPVAATTTPAATAPTAAATTTPTATAPTAATATAPTATTPAASVNAKPPVATPSAVAPASAPVPVSSNPWTTTDSLNLASAAGSASLVAKSLAETPQAKQAYEAAKKFTANAARATREFAGKGAVAAGKGATAAGKALGAGVSVAARLAGGAGLVETADQLIGRMLSDKDTGNMRAIEGISKGIQDSLPQNVWEAKRVEEIDNLISKRGAIIKARGINGEQKKLLSSPLTKQIQDLLGQKYTVAENNGQLDFFGRPAEYEWEKSDKQKQSRSIPTDAATESARITRRFLDNYENTQRKQRGEPPVFYLENNYRSGEPRDGSNDNNDRTMFANLTRNNSTDLRPQLETDREATRLRTDEIMRRELLLRQFQRLAPRGR